MVIQTMVRLVFAIVASAVLLSSAIVSRAQPQAKTPRDDRGAWERMRGWLFPPIGISVDWKRPPRYGLAYDRNGNKIPDLPNTREYVYGRDDCACTTADCMSEPARFRINFDVSKTSWPAVPSTKLIPMPKAENLPAVLRGIPGPRGVPQITAKEAQIEAVKFRERMRGYNINIVQSSPSSGVVISSATWDGTATGWTADKTTFSACLPEGEYDVTVLARDWLSGDWSQITKRITIEDFLIVSMGDSLAAGEGTPEQVIQGIIVATTKSEEATRMDLLLTADEDYRTAVWADDGKIPLKEITKTKLVASPFDVARPYSVTLRTNMLDYANFSEEAKDHRRYHRSSFAAASQAAMQIQDKSNKYSVTFVNLGMSGARTRLGMLDPYAGIRDEAFYGAPPKSQKAEIGKIIGLGRQIDALIMSVGANDAGFSNAISGLMARDDVSSHNPDEKKVILPAVRTGAWRLASERIPSIVKAAIWKHLEWDDRPGLDDLDARFTLIKTELQNVVKVTNTYVMEYPNFGRGPETWSLPPEVEQYGFKPGPRQTCKKVLDKYPASYKGVDFDLEVDWFELEWAYDNILVQLNSSLQRAAGLIGATFVGGIAEDSTIHGLCAPQPYDPINYAPSHPVPDRLTDNIRWFREVREALTIGVRKPDQNALILHPNEFGYLSTSKRLLSAMKVPPVKDDIIDTRSGKENLN